MKSHWVANLRVLGSIPSPAPYSTRPCSNAGPFCYGIEVIQYFMPEQIIQLHISAPLVDLSYYQIERSTSLIIYEYT